MSIGIIGLGLLVLIVAAGALLFRGLSLPTWKQVTLHCPHCGQETPAHQPACQHCHASFR